MSNLFEHLVRANVKRMKPYSSARDEFKGVANVYIDANENPFPNGLNRYPDPLQRALKAEIAQYYGLSADNILLGNGSDEPIDLLVRAFCVPQPETLDATDADAILITPPTYGMYEVCANVNNIRVIESSLLDDYSLNAEDIIHKISPSLKLIFLCSPNNPTGNLLDTSAILQITKATSGLVLVDEAYADFGQQSMLKAMLDYPNLVILKTFSKAWGLASIRLGMLFAHQDVLFWLNRIKAPYNINRMTIDCALQMLPKATNMAEQVQVIVAERQRIVSFLEQSVLVEKVFPSDANFVLVRFKDAQTIFDYLLTLGIVVRNRANLPECRGCLRLSVGLPQENDALMAALRAYSH